MPTSTNLAKYPQGMLDIVESVCETQHQATIAYGSEREANAERLRFYGLVRALVVNNHSLAERAIRLEFKTSGADRKNKNVLTIGFPENTKLDDFYASVAAKLEADTKEP